MILLLRILIGLTIVPCMGALLIAHLHPGWPARALFSLGLGTTSWLAVGLGHALERRDQGKPPDP